MFPTCFGAGERESGSRLADDCFCRTGWAASPGLLKFRPPFFHAFWASRFHFSSKLFHKNGGIEISAKRTNFQQLLKNASDDKNRRFYTLHTDAHGRLDDISLHHEPHFPQITSVFKPSHNMVRSTEESFARERQEDRDHAGCAASDNEAVVAEAAFLNSDHGTSMCAARRHSAKTHHLTRHLTPWHSALTPTAPHRQTTPAFQKFRPSSTSKWADGSQKPNFDPPVFFVLFNDRAADGRKHNAKMREDRNFQKTMHFFDVLFSFGEKQILETRCIKQHALLVDPLRDFYRFSNARPLMFFDSKRGAQTKKGIEIRAPSRSRVEISIPPHLPKCHSDRKGDQNGGHSEF